MRAKLFGKAITAVCVIAAVGAYAADKETGLTGNWATDAALTAVEKQTQGGLAESLLKSGISQGTQGAQRGMGGGGMGGGGFGGGGMGGGGGRTGGGGFGGNNFAPAQFGAGAGGGFPQGGGGMGGGGSMGGGGQFNRNGGINIDTGPKKVVKEGESKDGVALTMTLKADKKKISSGEVYDVVEKLTGKIEEGVVDGNKFEFKVYKKVGSIRIGTTYKGELTGPTTISLQRLKPSGDPVDVKEDGTPDILQFNRAAGKK